MFYRTNVSGIKVFVTLNHGLYVCVCKSEVSSATIVVGVVVIGVRSMFYLVLFGSKFWRAGG